MEMSLVNDKSAVVPTTTSPTATKQELPAHDPEKETSEASNDAHEHGDQNSNLQAGIRLAKAANRALTDRQLVIAYGFFQQHALTSTTTIIAGLASGLFQLPFAKILDLYGRPQGLALMLLFQTIGLVMMAACKDVETYCAAQVLYAVGYQGISFTITIFIADTCPLRHRALTLGLLGTPTIATVWAAGPAAQSVLRSIGLRWGFGIWCIVTPLVCAPWLFILVHVQQKAIAQGLVSTTSTPRSSVQSILHFLTEIDAIGLGILATGFSLFLLSFNLYTYQDHGWKSPMIICFIVFGGILVLSFPLYERHLAPKTFIAWPILKDRTILLAFAADLFYYMSEAAWGSYFYSILIVVFNKSVVDATYISNTYFVGSTVWMIVLGLAFNKFGHIKHYALFFGLPCTLLATGLQIKFRTSHSSIGLVAMCQIFSALGASGDGRVPAGQPYQRARRSWDCGPGGKGCRWERLQVGKAAAGTIGTAIWTDVFPKKLAEYLPTSSLPYLPAIYGSLYAQTSFPIGSPERDAIIHAYEYSSRLILIPAACLLAPCFVAVAFWRDYDVKNTNQLKRALFLSVSD
ncbi:hypothetical protein Asppvi_011104 [Aspergillus pseudoviridinutans]|uniref:MFS general substrate transporter n=1 Tax=Aspergillus pseudoviridinutans TaxID=1517512 RepID=A0A9P3BNJ4_9EURO|nr:uncharacterized protein Asppvi_011104 [Aspergillus pseudoviridinutans]GIJ92128.1 hypothetical protein Asppvi_011104 [Aspergillus pseudoviridinutans]